MPKHSLEQIKEKITERSKKTRELYLENIFNPKNQPKIESLGCANIAHVTASMPEHLKSYHGGVLCQKLKLTQDY